MTPDAPVFVAGAQTLIGAALVRQLKFRRFSHIFTEGQAVDLTDLQALTAFLCDVRPQFVIDCGGRSGGIAANQKFPADLMADNLLRTTHVLHAAHIAGVQKLLYLASSCSYPRMSLQPIRPEALLTGPLEPTNEAYAVAKIAGIKLCQSYRRQYSDDFIVGIPANAFGIEDDFSPEDSHVIGALIGKMHDAKLRRDRSVEVWGTGAARREFIFADDLADACLFAMQHYSGEAPLNLGGGETVSIAELAEIIREVVGFAGEIVFDRSKPDGMPLKSLDSSILQGLGWCPGTTLRDSLQATYLSFQACSSRAA